MVIPSLSTCSPTCKGGRRSLTPTFLSIQTQCIQGVCEGVCVRGGVPSSPPAPHLQPLPLRNGPGSLPLPASPVHVLLGRPGVSLTSAGRAQALQAPQPSRRAPALGGRVFPHPFPAIGTNPQHPRHRPGAVLFPTGRFPAPTSGGPWSSPCPIRPQAPLPVGRPGSPPE